MTGDLALTSKLIIGTANFGIKYGIANQKKLSERQISKIIFKASKIKIWGLDTARAYGDAENIIGKYINQTNLSIITKLPNKNYFKESDVINEVNHSLKSLRIKRFEVLLIHSFSNYLKDKEVLVTAMSKLIKGDIIKRWGVSIYHVNEVKQIINDGYNEIAIEFPVNLFDRRFLSEALIILLKKSNYMLIARSVFLQGLFVVKSSSLKGNLVHIKSKINKIYKLSKQYNIPIPAIALLFVLSQKNIDKIIIGVDSVEQLTNNIQALSYLKQYTAIEKDINKLRVADENILLPYKWKIS